MRALNSNEQIYIYGSSYGSVWLSRIMRFIEINQVSDVNIKGIVMDGVISTVDSKTSKRFTFDQSINY